MVGIVILAVCEYYIIRVKENLVQHPTDDNYIIYLYDVASYQYKQTENRQTKN